MDAIPIVTELPGLLLSAAVVVALMSLIYLLLERVQRLAQHGPRRQSLRQPLPQLLRSCCSHRAASFCSFAQCTTRNGRKPVGKWRGKRRNGSSARRQKEKPSFLPVRLRLRGK